MSPAADHLKDEVQRALDLLKNLSKADPPQKPLGVLNPKSIEHCKGLFFYHTKKIGLGVGVKWGAGVLVTHILDEDGKESWSAPVLYKVHEVSLGLLAGVGNIQTILILGSEKAVDQFRTAKTGPTVLGQDLSLGQTLGFDVIEDRNIFANRDVITHSLADGAIADWSLIGGKISVDRDANEAIYGRGFDVERVLGAPASTSPAAPAALRPLYAALDRIAGHAPSDLRSFDGFHKHWAPDLSPLMAKDS